MTTSIFPRDHADPRFESRRPDPRAILWWGLHLVMMLALLVVFVPLSPHMPWPGLDPSWHAAINHAVAEQLQFGREIAFTSGPYASVYTHAYHPNTDRMTVFASAYLAISFWIALAFAGRRDRRLLGASVLCATLAASIYLQDVYFLAYPLLAGMGAARLSVRRDGFPAGSLVLLAVLFAPFGLLALIKGTFATFCVGASLLCAGHFLLNRMVWHASVALAVPALSMLMFWIAAGQHSSHLIDFFGSMRETTAGYSEAMQLPGPMQDIVAFAVAALAISAFVVFLPAERRATKLFLLGLFGLFLFLTYKAGFVRHDGHAMISASGTLMAMILLIASFRSGFAPFAMLIVATCAVVVFRTYGTIAPDQFKLEVMETVGSAHRGLVDRLAGKARLRSRYEDVLSGIADSAGFPPLKGTVDIYSFNQSLLFASGLDWSPRPVFQSYAAYTPRLAQRNRQHLAGHAAPDHLLFRVETIDGRLPSMDDGASWPTIISRFRPKQMYGDYLHLERIAGWQPTDGVPAVIGDGPRRVSLGETVEVPAATGPVFARITIRPTLLGQWAGLVHKPSQLRMVATLANGSTRDFRIVSGMVADPFLISPLVESTTDFGLLLARPDELAGKAVRTFSIRAMAHPWQWQPEMQVEFSTSVVPPGSDLLDFLHLDPPLTPAPTLTIVEPDRCDGSIDVLNGIRATEARLTAGDTAHAAGWASPSAQTGELADATFLVLVDDQDQRHYFPTRTWPRPDVAKVFGQPQLVSAGFEARLDIRRLKGPLQARLALRRGDQLHLCPGSQLIDRG